MFYALEANTMNRDQTAPLTWVYVTCICKIGTKVHKQMREQTSKM